MSTATGPLSPGPAPAPPSPALSRAPVRLSKSKSNFGFIYFCFTSPPQNSNNFPAPAPWPESRTVIKGINFVSFVFCFHLPTSPGQWLIKTAQAPAHSDSPRPTPAHPGPASHLVPALESQISSHVHLVIREIISFYLLLFPNPPPNP